MVEVYLRPGQKADSVLRKFKKKVEAEGIMEEIRKRMFFRKPGEKRRLKHKRAVNRQRKEAEKFDGSRES